MQGVCPFFDYDFAYPENVLRIAPTKKTYPENSLMAYIRNHFPLWAFLIQTARLDWQFADPNFRGTLFIPQTINENVVMNADIDTARRIVKYHLMIGFFPKDVLFTSPYQQLQIAIKGETVRAVIQGPETMMLNEGVYITRFDIWKQNGIVHVIDKPLLPWGSMCSIP